MTRKTHRTLILAVLAAALLALTPALAASAVYTGPTPESIINSGSCPSGIARTQNNGRHHWILIERQLPTCVSPGEALYSCSYCEDTMTSHYASALGHTWGDWATPPGTFATCGRTVTQYRTCTRCGDRESRQITVAHQWGEWRVDEKPTCDQQGLNVRYCSVCGKDEWVYTPALGHNWDEVTIVRMPGMLRDGIIQYTCKNNPEHTKTERFPARGAGLSTAEIFDGLRFPGGSAALKEKLTILTQPKDGVLYPGGTVSLSVTVSGGVPPYAYQWYSVYSIGRRHVQAETIPGANGSVYAADKANRYYYCVVTDAMGTTVKSDLAQVSAGLYVSRQPEGGVVFKDETYTLSAKASGGAPDAGTGYAIQWYQTGGSAPRLLKTSATKTDNTLPVTEGGDYYCVFTDSQGQTVTSRTITVRKPEHPLAVSEMTFTMAPEYRSVSCDILHGEPPFKVYWSIMLDPLGDDWEVLEPLENVTDRHLTLPLSRYGEYHVEVSDAEGQYANQSEVYQGPAFQIVKQPEDTDLGPKGITQVSVTLLGGQAPYFAELIREDGSFYGYNYDPDDKSDTVSLDVNHPGTYYFEVTDANFAKVTSNKLTVKAYAELEVTVNEKEVYVDSISATVTIGVTAKNGTPPYTYQWKNWSSYPNASGTPDAFKYGYYISNVYTDSTCPVIAQGGHQRNVCVVTDAAGDSVTSEPITVYYDGAPWIYRNPQAAQTDSVYDTTYLYCRALPARTNAQSVLTYQWQQRTSSGWINYGPAQRGEDTKGFLSTLEISDGSQYGKYYRCVVTDTRTGKQSFSRAAMVSAKMRILSYQQVGKERKVQLVIEGGVAPYKAVAIGYYHRNAHSFIVYGIEADHWDGGDSPKFSRDQATYQHNADGTVTITVLNTDRYERCSGDIHFYWPVVVVIEHYNAAYNWMVFVTDATEETVKTEYIEMDW